MTLTGKTYDTLKWLALVGLPALGTFYFAMAGIWGLPAAEQVVGTIVSIDTFLGVVLKISASGFNTAQVGDIEVNELPNGVKSYSLALAGDPEELELNDEVRFNVVKKTKRKNEEGSTSVETPVALLVVGFAIVVIVTFGGIS